jgi:hypothetical protein
MIAVGNTVITFITLVVGGVLTLAGNLVPKTLESRKRSALARRRRPRSLRS